MTLLRSKTSNRFCGPAALALLTGIHVDEAARALRVVSGKRAVKGVLNRHMRDALYLLGYMALPVPTGGKPTLTQALQGALGNRGEAAYLVVVTGHYVVIRGRMLYDNKHPQGVRLTECPYRRKRVRAVFAVEMHGAPTLPPRPMTLARFTAAIERDRVGLSTDGSYVNAPDGYHFQTSGLHSLAVTGTYEEMLRQVREELIEACPADCECRD